MLHSDSFKHKVKNTKMELFLVLLNSCAVKSADPVTCLPGSFAPAGSLECLECPLGSHCPSSALPTHTPCSPGSYANETSSTECSACPAGFVCQTPSQSPVMCENGTFSKGNAVNCSLCPAGFRYCSVTIFHCFQDIIYLVMGDITGE